MTRVRTTLTFFASRSTTYGIASQQAPGSEDAAAQYAVGLDGLHRVGRARRVVLAPRRQRRRQHALVGANRGERDAPGRSAHAAGPSAPASGASRGSGAALAPLIASTSSASAVRTPGMPSRSASSRLSGRATTT